MSKAWSRLHPATSILLIFALSGGRGCPACQPPPVARRRPACRGFGARWGRGRAPQLQINSDVPAGLKSRRRPDGQSHLILNTRYGRPGGLCPNYDLIEILLPPADVFAGYRSRWCVTPGRLQHPSTQLDGKSKPDKVQVSGRNWHRGPMDSIGTSELIWGWGARPRPHLAPNPWHAGRPPGNRGRLARRAAPPP